VDLFSIYWLNTGNIMMVKFHNGDVMMDIFIKPGFAGDSVIFVVNPPCLKVLKSTGTLLGAILSRRFEGIAGGKAWPQLSTWIQDLGETTRHWWW
jgi:hypothetical protein